MCNLVDPMVCNENSEWMIELEQKGGGDFCGSR